MLEQYKLEEYGDILTPKDVSKILRVGIRTTYELLNTGAIQSFKIGHSRKIPKRCLETYVQRMVDEHQSQ